MSDPGMFRRSVAWVYSLATSARTAFWLMSAWLLLLAVWVLPFPLLGQSESTVAGIAEDWLVLRVVVWVLGVCTLLCMATRISRDWRRCSRMVLPRPGAIVEGASATDSKEPFGRFTERLTAEGYDTTVRDPVARAVKGRYRPLWGAAFHLGLLVLAMSLVLAAATLKRANVELIEGQSARESLSSTAAKMDPGLRSVLGDIRLTAVTPRFFGRYLFFDRLNATVKRTGGSRTFSLAQPLWVDPVTYVSIQDFNYAPKVVERAADGAILDVTVNSLKLFPPGNEDSLMLRSLGIRCVIEVFPDHAVMNGKDVSKSFNLVDPRFRVTVFDAARASTDVILVRRIAKLGERIVLPDGSSLEISEIRKVGTFTVVRCPALPLVLLGGLLVVMGLAGRMLWPRVDILAVRTDQGTRFDVRVDGRHVTAADALRRTLADGGGEPA